MRRYRNVTGGAGQLAQASLGAGTRSQSQQIKGIADNYPANKTANGTVITDNTESGVVRTLLQGLADCTAAIGGGNCGAGATSTTE
jgi:hypothetical protein